MRKADGSLADNSSFKADIVPLGGGGFVTGLDISADGRRIVCRTDVNNGYIRNAADSRWTPLFTQESLTKFDYDNLPPAANNGSQKADSGAVAGVRIAPSDKDIIYACWYGYAWKSLDGGDHWIKQGLNKYMWAGIGNNRLHDGMIDVHPTDPDIVIIGTYNDGVHYSTDGGVTWAENTSIPTIPKPEGLVRWRYLVLIDPATPANVYVQATGSGLYRSTTGVDGTFSLIPGSPTMAAAIVAGPANAVWIAPWRNGGATINQVYKYVAGRTVTTYNTPNIAPVTLAVDPFDPDHILLMGENGGIAKSIDGGVSFNIVPAARSPEGDVHHINVTSSLFPAKVMFDPVVRGQFWVAEGLGVDRGALSGNTASYICTTLGIEELIPNHILAAPGSGSTHLLISCWDRAFWRIDDLQQATSYGRWPDNAGSTANKGYSMDYATDDPDFIVGTCFGGNLTGYSDDGGRTWHRFSAFPAEPGGGAIAVSNKDNIVVCGTNGAPLQYTLNRGATWNNVTLGSESPVTRQIPAYYVARKPLSADKTRRGVFGFIYNNADTSVFPNTVGRPNAGFWLTNDGGVTWSQRFSGVIGDNTSQNPRLAVPGYDRQQFWQAQLQAVPGGTGEWVYSPSNTSQELLWFSADDGLSWYRLGGDLTRHVTAFGFGKGLEGQTRPALYFYGRYNGVYALYATFDWFASHPIQIRSRYSKQIARPQYYCIEGDPNVFGRVYIGYGVGVDYVDYEDVASAV